MTSEEFSGGGCDDPNVEVVDQQNDGGAFVGAADADVVHATAARQRHRTGFADPVMLDPVVRASETVRVLGCQCEIVIDGGHWLIHLPPALATVIVGERGLQKEFGV